ncbi:PAS domain S-box-containing protein [Symbiobacterium terraclitae]|uniref:PAS domain S-box-containing protein n=1 Tax=Symbiobacterium terraclitae TaxID=557451 RepID=A0ABS4JPL3_9FIRM|nr:sigma 54-interacting transcriptional regulator [Symbiobacterium terraclitae]MBP2017487.1 PAS domain S-box-containing protein [Symbiobacterium terraclitae]
MGASLLTASALMSQRFMALEEGTWNGGLPAEPDLVVIRTAGGRPCGAASCAQLADYLGRHPGAGPESFPWLPVRVVPASLPVAAIILEPGPAFTVVTHADGTPAGVLCWADVARHYHEAYRRLDAQFTATLNTLEESVCMVDEDGRVIAWNPAAERLFGIRSSEITGRPLADFFPGRDQYSLRALATGATAHRTLHEPHPEKWVVVNAAPIRLGDRIIGALAVEQDVTSVVRLHEQLDRTTSAYKALEGEISRIRERGDAFERITGRGHAIQRTVNLARRVAASDATVLIRGESGVGKELFARAIHDASERRDKPFVAINCGAIPPALFESELFGYERGAFTGADQKGKSGKLEQAQGGTLFLDEVAELPAETQVKLLRVLQDRRFYRLGSDRPRVADVRIIAATNRNLEEMLRQGTFREDLYFRLDVVTLEIPPLRERLEDLADMVHQFAREFALRHKRPVQGIEPGVMAALMEYSWPGNIRELRNVIERLVVLSDDGMIKAEYLPPTIGRGRPPEPPGSGGAWHGRPQEPPEQAGESGAWSAPAADLPSAAREAQRAAILAALKETGQNRSLAAKRLGISRSALYYQMRRLGIS